MTPPLDISDKDLAIASIARNNFLAYCFSVYEKFESNWHIELLCKKLMEVATTPNKRLMVCMPPRHGKSLTCSTLFPSWYLGKFPDRQLITASYSQRLAAGFGREVRNMMAEPRYNFIFPNTQLSEDSKAKDLFITHKGGKYFATGRGTMTGMGADLLLIDDPIRDAEEVMSEVVMETVWSWWNAVASTRLMPGGSVVLIQTRWGEKDLAGRILESEGRIENGGDWEVLEFPAIAEEDEEYRETGEALWPSKYPAERLLKIKKNDLVTFSCLYQQRPMNEEAAEFKRSWFKRIKIDEIPSSLRIITTVDLAISTKKDADRSVVLTIGVAPDGSKYVLKIDVKRGATMDEVAEWIYEHHRQFKIDTLAIETVAYQEAFKQYFDKESRRKGIFINTEGVKTRKEKGMKIRGLIPHYKHGVLYHPEIQNMDELESELMRFPRGKHDDIIDALALGMDFWDSGIYTVQVPKKSQITIKELLREEGFGRREQFDILKTRQ